MKKVKASRKMSAVTQPNQVGLSFHVENWVAEKARLENSEKELIVNTILDRARVEERERCNPPFISAECCAVATWRCHDGTWEKLLYNDNARIFYLDWSFAEPADVTMSEALHWYGQKRAMECDYGELDVYNLSVLISAAARSLREWEDVQERGFEVWQKERGEAFASLKRLAERSAK